MHCTFARSTQNTEECNNMNNRAMHPIAFALAWRPHVMFKERTCGQELLAIASSFCVQTVNQIRVANTQVFTHMFANVHPDVQISLINSYTDEQLDEQVNGKVDLLSYGTRDFIRRNAEIGFSLLTQPGEKKMNVYSAEGLFIEISCKLQVRRC